MNIPLSELFDDVNSIFDRLGVDKARFEFRGDGDDGLVTFDHFVIEAEERTIGFKPPLLGGAHVEDGSFPRVRIREKFDDATGTWTKQSELVDVAWSQILLDLAYVALESKASGWECGDGSYGEVEIRRNSVVVDMFRRTEWLDDEGESDWDEEHESHLFERPI